MFHGEKWKGLTKSTEHQASKEITHQEQLVLSWKCHKKAALYPSASRSETL
ncbi:hypothetical protein GCM10009425_45640 [Pseudomonas asuensis]|uniref:Uncharacterized protein n=1 Tax=Pseudomonas asuensis TaxID=1825787 RepID=A0ABQ2H3X7_9PSED|nr:hypothetical protein GCM10009425_45640 [Pseudomonas asuensis]